MTNEQVPSAIVIGAGISGVRSGAYVWEMIDGSHTLTFSCTCEQKVSLADSILTLYISGSKCLLFEARRLQRCCCGQGDSRSERYFLCKWGLDSHECLEKCWRWQLSSHVQGVSEHSGPSSKGECVLLLWQVASFQTPLLQVDESLLQKPKFVICVGGVEGLTLQQEREQQRSRRGPVQLRIG